MSLLDKVPVLKSERVGINIPNAKKTDYDICLECEFASWEDVDIYQSHPEHLKVATYIGKCRTARSFRPNHLLIRSSCFDGRGI